MNSLHLRGVQMMSKKKKLQKYLEIRKGAKNLKIPNSLPLLNFKNFGKIKFIKKLVRDVKFHIFTNYYKIFIFNISTNILYN